LFDARDKFNFTGNIKFIKAGEAQDEHTILEEVFEGFIDIIPKLRKLIIKIQSSS